jgi:hypothetical protein
MSHCDIAFNTRIGGALRPSSMQRLRCNRPPRALMPRVLFGIAEPGFRPPDSCLAQSSRVQSRPQYGILDCATRRGATRGKRAGPLSPAVAPLLLSRRAVRRSAADAEGSPPSGDDPHVFRSPIAWSDAASRYTSEFSKGGVLKGEASILPFCSFPSSYS